MSATDELSRAQELVDLRRRVWVCLLDYPPFAEAMCAYIEAELGEAEPPVEALAALRQATLALRERDTQVTLKAYAQAREGLVEALHVHRGEGSLVRALTGELERIGARRVGGARGVGGRAGDRGAQLLEVRTPPRGSKVFRSYLAAVRRAEAELIHARQRFVARNLRLVVTIARRYNHAFLTQADLIQEGTLGLLRAVDGYDPKRGTRFSTYAAWWIKHGITRALANHGLTIRVPANVLGLRTQLVRSEQAFIAAQGRLPTDQELAKELAVPLKIVRNARRAVLGQVDLPSASENLADDKLLDLDEILDQPLVVHEVLDLIERLPGIEGAVIRKRFALDGDAPMTLAEIGDLHCLSRERIRQIEKQALLRMRGELRSRGIEQGA